MWQFMFINGLGFTILSGNLITLIALHYNASNTWLGLFSSLLAYAGLAQIFTPRLLGGYSLTGTMSRLWLVRGVLIGLLLLAPIVDDQLSPGHILLGIFLANVAFSVCRSIGGVLIQSVVTGLSTQDDAGAVTARIFGPNGYCGIMSSILAWLIIWRGVFGDARDLFLIIAIGCTLNTLAGLLMRRVPYTATIERRGCGAIFREIHRLLHRHETRILLGLTLGLGTLQIGSHMYVAYLGKICGFSRSDLMGLQIAIYLAYTLGILATRKSGDRFGSRPLLQLGAAGTSVCFLLAAYLPAAWRTSLLMLGFPIFALTMFLMLLVQRLAVLYGPPEDQVAFRGALRFVQSVTGILAGYLGIVCDLAELHPALRLGGHPYTLLFLLMAFSMLVFLFLARRLREENASRARHTLSALARGLQRRVTLL
jgi:hypothetical protein